MYRTLFTLAGFAIVAWLPLIFLPTFRATRRLAESAVFPAYLCALYAAGIVAFVREAGWGFMSQFGTADGVLGLLASEPVALIAWLHILAFDQVVGLLIYRDNMEHRVVPVPVQSVLLVATLMLGPLGFLTYWAVRVVRLRPRGVAWGERAAWPAPEPEPPPVRFGDLVERPSVVAAVLALWRREPVLVRLGALGIGLAAVCAVIAAINGSWLLGAEGRLLEAAKFDTALAIYTLTLAVVLPLAGLPPGRHARWIRWAVGLTLFAYAMENVQSWRGLDPRFSTIAGPIDRMLGGVFFFSALGIMALFVIVALRFFRATSLPDHPALRLALRYAAAAALLAFGVGIVISFVGSRFIAGTGNLMPVHAAGFHGLQAVPLVALLLGWSAVPAATALLWTHLAGAGWVALCAGLLVQAAAGSPALAAGPGLGFVATGAAVWAVALGYALRARTAGALVRAA